MDDQTKQQVQQMIDQSLTGAFQKRIGDTPTDALQLTPKKYVDKKIPLSSVLSKGDLIVGTKSSVVSNLAVGADNTVLTADSTQPLGMKWAPDTETSNQLTEVYTSAEAITAGNAVSMGPYQSDGGIIVDTSLSSIPTAVSGSYTFSYTVGNFTNRLLVLFVISANGSGVSATYNAVSMTSAFTQLANGGDTLYGFYLAGPATGANNVVISGLSGTEQFTYGIYSYYNVASSGSIAQALTSTATSTGSISKTLTPLNGGSIILTCTWLSATGTYTGINMNNNPQTPTIGSPVNNGLFMGDSGRVTNTNNITVSTSRSAGTINWIMANLELKPFTSVTYKIWKSSTTNSYNTPAWNPDWSSNAFIGFSQQTVASIVSCSVLLAGTDNNQSSILPTSQYYLGTNGAIATTGTRKVGIATSTTEILITNQW